VRRGILGGTFDPPHLAHLLGGEAAHREMDLDVVSFMPAGSPWQKAERDVTGASDRWEMTVLATGGIDYFEADDREVRRQGWTYTIDTLESLDDTEDIVLILGADTGGSIIGWMFPNSRSAERCCDVGRAVGRASGSLSPRWSTTT
jgi:nicotinate-nucleotide adenylyltransferase